MLHNTLRAAAGGGHKIPTDGLVAWYSMDNVSGTTLFDQLGGYDGTISGATQVPGVIGDALQFDGVDDMVIVSGLPDLSAGLTLCFWLYTAGPPEGLGGPIRLAQLPEFGVGSAYGLGVLGGPSRFRILGRSESGGASQTFDEISYSSVGSGYHFWVLQFSPAWGKRAYCDGNLVMHESTPTLAGTGDLYLGSTLPGLEPCACALDQVRIYSRPISLSEMSALHEEGL